MNNLVFNTSSSFQSLGRSMNRFIIGPLMIELSRASTTSATNISA